MREAMMRRYLAVLAVLLGVFATSGQAMAQEIQLTGPLAGAPAVRKLRLRRQSRFELAPQVSFTLLDEYMRTILIGARANYNATDWLAVGVWGAFGAIHTTAALSDHIDEVTKFRRSTETSDSLGNRLTAASIGRSFTDTNLKNQLGKIDLVVSAPQFTLVPFRGKLAIFQKIFVDTDAYVFGGPAFVQLTERQDCDGNCATSFGTKDRWAITGTFGIGMSFYVGKWASLGLEWRGLPFAWNTGGFDTRGGPPDGRFPDLKVNDKDREFKFNSMLSVSFGVSFPLQPKLSE
jgi:hypothetical protein